MKETINMYSISELVKKIVNTTFTTEELKYYYHDSTDNLELNLEYLRLDFGLFFLKFTLNVRTQVRFLQEENLSDEWTILYIMDESFKPYKIDFGLLIINSNEEKKIQFDQNTNNSFYINLLNKSFLKINAFSLINDFIQFNLSNNCIILTPSQLLEIKKCSNPKMGIIKIKDAIIKFLSKLNNQIQVDLKQNISNYCEYAYVHKMDLSAYLAIRYSIELSNVETDFFKVFKVKVSDFFKNYKCLKLKEFLQSDKDILDNYFLRNLQECVSPVSALSLEFSISPIVVEVIFNDFFGVTETTYIRNLRIDFIKKLKLKGEKVKIKLLSDYLGFKNINSLIKFFKKYNGMPPGKYLRI